MRRDSRALEPVGDECFDEERNAKRCDPSPLLGFVAVARGQGDQRGPAIFEEDVGRERDDVAFDPNVRRDPRPASASEACASSLLDPMPCARVRANGRL